MMARRTKKEAAATRAALLDAALRVFRERGVAQASLAEVAAAAGVTRGAVYWHFRDKSDLFDALCAQVPLPMEVMLAQAGETRQEDPLAALRKLAVLGLTRLAGDTRAQAVFDVASHTCTLTGRHASLTKRRRTTGSGCRAHVERLLRQAVARRQLPSRTDTALAAEMVNAFLAGVMQQWVDAPGAYDLARAAPAMVDSLLAGLAARPPLRARAARARQSAASEPAPRSLRGAA